MVVIGFICVRFQQGTNAGHLALDFHDDTNDVRFSIRNVHSSGQDPDVITEVFDVKSAGGGDGTYSGV